MRTAREYLAQLLALLPRGPLWDGLRQPAALFHRLLAAAAEEPARVDGRAADLANELDPRAAYELLEEWERFVGLPDPCTGPAETLQERRNRVTQQLIGLGGQSRADILEIAARLGYEDVEITTYSPFTAGVSRCGDPLNPPLMRCVWRVEVPGARATRFRTGLSQCGDKLLSLARAEDLECILRRRERAHTRTIISYEGGV